MLKLRKKFEKYLMSISLKKKLMLLFVFCVLIPLFITDGIVFYNMYKVNSITKQQELRSDAEAIKYSFVDSLNYPSKIIQNVYKNEEVEELLNKQYYDPLDYYTAYMDFKKDSIYESWLGIGNETLEIYADNDTILNGGMFYKLDPIKNEAWYKKLDEGEGMVLSFDFSKEPTDTSSKRNVLLMRKMEMARKNRCEKVIKLTINYRKFQENVLGEGIESDAYICLGDKLLMTNVGGTHLKEAYRFMDKSVKPDYQQDIYIYGETYNIYLKNKGFGIWMLDYKSTIMVLIMLFISFILPVYMIKQLDYSVAQRIGRMSKVLENADDEYLKKIRRIEGDDEISSLMVNYNRMVDRMNSLIQTSYIDKLKQQEMDIARQNAELLALHSQINPHFLFNALESIRMHSLLKSENETAEMVEHLAVMQRVNVDWRSDEVSVEEEMKFAQAYLELQKYRFGERLSYSLDVDPACYGYMLPKLSIVTFIENACVHGIESKTEPGWIFVRIYKDDQNIFFEVEDTGIGMDEEMRENLLFKMNHASLELIKMGTGVGMTNASLRLKMMTKDTLKIEIETEMGVGTNIRIIIPLDAKDNDKKNKNKPINKQ